MTAVESDSVERTIGLGRALAAHLAEDDVIVLSGDLGAGKTQFAKGVAEGLGVREQITSPTFGILLEYEGDDLRLLHFDLYRLEDDAELDDIDYFGMIESGGVSLVEWGTQFDVAVPDECLVVHIGIGGDGTRTVEATGRGRRGEQLERAFAACAGHPLPN